MDSSPGSTEPERPRTWTNPQQLVGTTLDARYTLERVLGAGGMGAVFEAEQKTLRKRVAIKVLDPQLAQNPDHVERFLREAQAASKVRNMHVVDISDFGQVPGGSVYYVMELLDGKDLAHLISQLGRLSWPRAKSILLQAAHALTAAHDQGVVHRDIKPANCVILQDPDEPGRDFVKVVDFGIAKIFEADAKGLTRPNEIMGTVAYMAPEQALCRPVDVRTDIYALGIVAFEMLTGRVPFLAASAFDVLDMHCTAPPPAMTSFIPDLPTALDSVIQKALSKHPEDRYQDMRSFERALRSVGDDGAHVVDKAEALGMAPTMAPGAAFVDSGRALSDSGAAVPIGSTVPQRAIETDPSRIQRSPLPKPSDVHRASGPSTASTAMIVVLWMVVLTGGVVFGAWLVTTLVG